MKKLYGVIAALATVIAAALASSACWMYLYQPAEPTSLEDK